MNARTETTKNKFMSCIQINLPGFNLPCIHRLAAVSERSFLFSEQNIEINQSAHRIRNAANDANKQKMSCSRAGLSRGL